MLILLFITLLVGEVVEYRYKAKTSNGKIMSGSLSANNETEVLTWVRRNGWIPIDVSRAYEMALQITETATGRKIKKNDLFDFSRRIKLRDKSVFFRQLATLISAGVPIASAIEILVEQTSNKRLKKIISSMHYRISAGSTLGSAMAEHTRVFDTLSVALVKAGEESGNLDDSLSRLATFLEDQDALRKKIISALTYPTTVILIALIVLALMVTVVIPQFEKAFQNLNVQMPKLTEMTFEIGKWIRVNWYVFPFFIVMLLLILRYVKRVPKLKIYTDALMLKMPIFGNILYKSSVSRAFYTMSSLLNSGVPVLTSLEISGEVAANEKIKQSFLHMRDAAAIGKLINGVMKDKKLFSPMVINMVAVGEETGRTDEMLQKVAIWYEQELTETIKRLSSLLEPIMIVFVGIVVGFMVMAIFLPIISSIRVFL